MWLPPVSYTHLDVYKRQVYDTIRQLKRMAAGLEAAINGLERSMDRFREDEEAGHG